MYNFYQYFLVLVAIALKRKFFHSICVGVVNYEFRDDVSGSLAIIFRIQHHFQEQVCKTASLFPEYKSIQPKNFEHRIADWIPIGAVTVFSSSRD